MYVLQIKIYILLNYIFILQKKNFDHKKYKIYRKHPIFGIS